MKKTVILILLGLCGVCQAQWPQWRGPMRDGSSTETALLKSWPTGGPRLLWSCDAIGAGYSSAIIQDGRIYITGKTNSARIMTALDLSGEVAWQTDLSETGGDQAADECSTPTFYEGRLYTVTGVGDICFVDASTGDVDWKLNIWDEFGVSDYICESPLIVEDKVILTPCGENATVVALDSATGERVWTSESVGEVSAYVSPVLIQGEDRKLIVTNARGHAFATDLATGRIVWQHDLPNETFVPLARGRQVYFPGCVMLAISDDLNSCEALWRDARKTKMFGGAVRLGSRLFGTYESESGIYGLDWATGEQVACNDEIAGANLLVADGMIYSYEEASGRVSLLRPTDDRIDIVGSFEVPLGAGPHLAHMSIGNGRLFIRHEAALMAYDIRQP